MRTIDDVESLARTMLAMGPTYVLIKGGHLVDAAHPDRSPDLLLSAAS